MKHLIRNALVAVLGVGLAGLVGCEWGGGGSDNSWNDSSTIANFNGSYQANGGYLVSDYSSSASAGGGTTTTTTGGFIPPLEEVNASFSGNSFPLPRNLFRFDRARSRLPLRMEQRGRQRIMVRAD